MPKIKFGCGLDMDLTAKIAECEGHRQAVNVLLKRLDFLPKTFIVLQVDNNILTNCDSLVIVVTAL